MGNSVSGAAGGEFLAVLVPGVDPAALTACEGVARSSQHLAHAAHRERVQPLALGRIGIVPTAMFNDVERLAVGYHVALTCAESIYFLAILVIDVMPRTGSLDVADLLGLHGGECHEHDEENKNSFHNDMVYLMIFMSFLSAV